MAWNDWKPEMPVVVMGVINGEITPDGSGFQKFDSLEHVRQTFRDVDPEKNGLRFTWAMAGETNEGKSRIRFMTWKAYNKFVDGLGF